MKTVTIPNFPDDLREQMKARAKSEGLSFNAYALHLLKTNLETPTREEFERRIAARARRRGVR